MKITVERLLEIDIKKVANMASENFPEMKDEAKATRWVYSNFKCFPRMQYFLAISQGEVIGYILWVEQMGPNIESVWQLEQIAVKEEFQGKGIGTILYKESFEKIKEYLKKRQSFLKLIYIFVGAQALAQKFFEKLGANIECGIRDLFNGNKVIMVIRFDKK